MPMVANSTKINIMKTPMFVNSGSDATRLLINVLIPNSYLIIIAVLTFNLINKLQWPKNHSDKSQPLITLRCYHHFNVSRDNNQDIVEMPYISEV
jgi:hypothetical protein